MIIIYAAVQRKEAMLSSMPPLPISPVYHSCTTRIRNSLLGYMYNNIKKIIYSLLLCVKAYNKINYHENWFQVYLKTMTRGPTLNQVHLMLSMQSILDNFNGKPPIKGIVGGVGIACIFYLTAYNIENKTEKTFKWHNIKCMSSICYVSTRYQSSSQAYLTKHLK